MAEAILLLDVAIQKRDQETLDKYPNVDGYIRPLYKGEFDSPPEAGENIILVGRLSADGTDRFRLSLRGNAPPDAGTFVSLTARQITCLLQLCDLKSRDPELWKTWCQMQGFGAPQKAKK